MCRVLLIRLVEQGLQVWVRNVLNAGVVLYMCTTAAIREGHPEFSHFHSWVVGCVSEGLKAIGISFQGLAHW